MSDNPVLHALERLELSEEQLKDAVPGTAVSYHSVVNALLGIGWALLAIARKP